MSGRPIGPRTRKVRGSSRRSTGDTSVGVHEGDGQRPGDMRGEDDFQSSTALVRVRALSSSLRSRRRCREYRSGCTVGSAPSINPGEMHVVEPSRNVMKNVPATARHERPGNVRLRAARHSSRQGPRRRLHGELRDGGSSSRKLVPGEAKVAAFHAPSDRMQCRRRCRERHRDVGRVALASAPTRETFIVQSLAAGDERVRVRVARGEVRSVRLRRLADRNASLSSGLAP